MPNWCECDLEILGIKKELKRFSRFAKTKKGKEINVLDTNKFIPYPKKFLDLDKKSEKWEKKAEEFAKKKGVKGYYDLSEDIKKQFEAKNPKIKDGFNSGGFEWCCKNWGTKWGICNAEINKDYYGDNRLFYSFETAWSPPYPLILKMSKLFPELEFVLRYFEGGCGFNGLFKCKKGKRIVNKSGEYFGDRGG